MYSLKKIYSSLFYLIFIVFVFNINFLSHASGYTHHLKNNWYDEEVLNLKKSEVTSIIFTNEEEPIEYVNSYEIDNFGLSVFSTQNNEIIVYFPSNNIVKLEEDVSDLFNFYIEIEDENDEESNIKKYESKLSSITGIELLDTSDVKNMTYMFANLTSLNSINISNIDTSNVVNMMWMFQNCKSLVSVKFYNIDLSRVLFQHSVFSDCQKLNLIDLEKVKMPYSLRGFFSNITSKSLNIINLNTANVTDMHDLFSDCYNLNVLNVDSLDTSKVEDMSFMFSNCYNLKSFNISNFNTSNVKDMSYMFYYNKSFEELDLSNFDTSKVTNMSCMFSNCINLKKLNVSNFITKNVENFHEIFYNLRSLTEIDLSSFDINKTFEDNYNNKILDTKISLKYLSYLNTLKINKNIADHIYDLEIVGVWKNKQNGAIIDTKYKDLNNNKFIEGTYFRTNYYVLDFDPKNILNMENMYIGMNESLNLKRDIFNIDDSDNPYNTKGFNFRGWYYDKEYKNKINDILIVDKPMTLYAKLDIKKYKVTFNTNGGTSIPTQFVEYNHQALNPTTIPIKKNYIFEGWYIDDLYNEKFNFNTPIVDDTELFAKYRFNLE